jgi:hypothetical protein
MMLINIGKINFLINILIIKNMSGFSFFKGIQTRNIQIAGMRNLNLR